MNRLIDVVLEDQSVLLIKMGELTYQTLYISIKAYLEGSTVQGQVREMSDQLMLMADKVEARSFELITRFQPVASDLRTIKSYMKIGYDFARYGRYALDISYINDQITGLKDCCSIEIKKAVEKMSEKVLQMVKISVDALRKHDVKLARTITETEREVDEMYLNHLKNLLEEKNTTSSCIVSSALMSRYLERIADHAVYVCESILYIVTGEKTRLR
ncbi:MAG: phosphate signaling complex protein PhoU [Nitrososphaerota archaeon]|jgi:phosphate transport system protein|nr:phosphate signaling complex protein PhoU [Nitrososphaerota archaeon]